MGHGLELHLITSLSAHTQQRLGRCVNFANANKRQRVKTGQTERNVLSINVSLTNNADTDS